MQKNMFLFSAISYTNRFTNVVVVYNSILVTNLCAGFFYRQLDIPCY